MGDAALRRTYEAQIVKVDLNIPSIIVSNSDKVALGEFYKAKLIKLTIFKIVEAAYPHGMSKAESENWEIWQEFLLDDDVVEDFDLPYGSVLWLKKLVDKDDLKIPIGFVQWRSALSSYLATVEPASLKSTQ